jgi:HAE1 family hydrophobic/amphiphilic exporter-1
MAGILRALALSAGLVLLVLAAQFESVRLPVLIFAAVPLALVGVVIALLLTGGSLNAFSGIGLMILVGIVVNDSILKVDLFARLTAKGATVNEAIHEASRRRYRPILMTTLTTTLALVPLFFGSASSFVAPLAATVIGGLASATILTLLAIPTLYRVIQRDPVKDPDSAVRAAS